MSSTSRIEKRQYRIGVIKSPPMGTIISMVAPATPVAAYLLTIGRTCKIRKIHLWNGQAAPVLVDIGTGLAPLVPAIPPLYVVNGMELVLREEDIPDVEFTADITVQASAAGAAPADVRCVLTVEEYLGPSG